MTASAIRTRLAGRPLAVPLLLAGLALGTGCSVLPFPGRSPTPDAPALVDDFPRSRRVAVDFVAAMTTSPALVPTGTTLYTARPASRFGEILVAALQGAGYDLRLGVDDSPVTLDYDVRAAGADGEERYVFVVVADGVRLERSYVADVAGIRADSPMRVDGRDRAPRARSAHRRPDPAPAPAPAVTPTPTPAIAPAPAPGTAVVVTAVPAPAGPATAAPSPAPFERNLHDTGRSRHAELLDDYATVRRDVMVFPNDSLHMGRDNKRLARRIARAFDPERDLVSVIGCSHGRTALANGNATLAAGRAHRVKEALVLAGIDAERVLEEGCWAGTSYAPMPARGVVVTHKRRTTG